MQYTIKRGDTLTSIAKRFGTTVAALQAANSIRNKNAIRAGTTLMIGQQPSPAIDPRSQAALTQGTNTPSVPLDMRAMTGMAPIPGNMQAQGQAGVPTQAMAQGGVTPQQFTPQQLAAALASQYGSSAPASPNSSSYYPGSLGDSGNYTPANVAGLVPQTMQQLPAANSANPLQAQLDAYALRLKGAR